MMNRLFSTLKQVRLNAEEQARMRRNLVAFMDTVPVERHAGWFSFLRPRGHFYTSLGIAGLILALFGSTAYAASNSLPGDPLYPIKTQINEPVQKALTFTPEGKAEVSAHFADNRLSELEELTANGSLNESNLQTVEQNFNNNTTKVQAQIADFEAKGQHDKAAQLAQRLQTSLTVHQAILTDLHSQKKSNDTTNISQNLIQNLGSQIKSAAADRQDNEEQITKENKSALQNAAQNRRAAAENNVSELQQYLNRQSWPQNVTQTLNSQIGIAQNLIAQGDKAYGQGDFASAFKLFQKAAEQIQTASLIAQTQKNLKFNVNIGNGSENTSTDPNHQDNSGQVEGSHTVNPNSHSDQKNHHQDNNED